jgi:putative ABC transport system permease protein
MISLAGRDILHTWGKFVFTGIGLGLLIGVTLTMAGVYRGMVDDGKALLDNSGADLWVVQKDTLGPYAESSSVPDDLYRGIPRHARRGRSAANITYLTMQVRKGEQDVRAMVVGIAPGGRATPGWPPTWWPGARSRAAITRPWPTCRQRRAPGRPLRIRRNQYTVVGLTRRMVSSSGDPMVFIPLKDAQEAQFLKDNDAILAAAAAAPRPTRPSTARRARLAGRGDRLAEQQPMSTPCWCTLQPGHGRRGGRAIRRWKRLTVYTRAQMEGILVGKLIATSAGRSACSW